MLVKTADLWDQAPAEARTCMAPWRSFGGRPAAAGHVATLRIFEDAALLREHLANTGEGRILVVDAGGSQRVAVLGDNMARLGQRQGWAGILIFGAVRDVEALKAMEIAIFALGSVPARADQAGAGEWDVELNVGGVSIRPGEFIAMDRDGVVVMANAPAA